MHKLKQYTVQIKKGRLHKNFTTVLKQTLFSFTNEPNAVGIVFVKSLKFCKVFFDLQCINKNKWKRKEKKKLNRIFIAVS